jgi:hypothetical protein
MMNEGDANQTENSQLSKKLEAEIAQLNKKSEAEIAQLNKKLEAYKRKYTELETKYNLTRNRLERELSKSHSVKDRMVSLVRDNGLQNAKYNDAKERYYKMQSVYDAEIKEMARRYEEKLKKMERMYEEKLREMERKISNLRDDFQEEIVNEMEMEWQYGTQIQSGRAPYDDDDSMDDENEAMTGVLMKVKAIDAGVTAEEVDTDVDMVVAENRFEILYTPPQRDPFEILLAEDKAVYQSICLDIAAFAISVDDRKAYEHHQLFNILTVSRSTKEAFGLLDKMVSGYVSCVENFNPPPIVHASCFDRIAFEVRMCRTHKKKYLVSKRNAWCISCCFFETRRT